MNILHYIWSFLLALAVLIAVHEYGHYLAARLCGVKVLRFSLGFGHTIFSRKWGRDQTEWALGIFPLGGYVKMLDESEGEVPVEERHRAFNTQALWKRAIVVVAGPLANLLLAIFVYWCLFMVGSRELLPVLGPVTAGSVAERAGLLAGERITRIGGESVESWADLRWVIVDRGLDRATVEVESRAPNGSTQLRMLDLSGMVIDDRVDPVRQIGLSLPEADLPPVIASVAPGGPAERAGLREGDVILNVDGARVSQFREFADAIAKHPAQSIRLDVKRGGKLLTLNAVPDSVVGPDKNPRGRLGVGAKQDPAALDRFTTMVSYPPLPALWHATVQTWQTTTFTVKGMVKLVTGQISLRNVSGPVTIADYAGKTATAGLETYLRFLALISISLGVLNLMPVPILDGGHLLYYAVEAIRGKPLPERVLEWGQKAGIAALASLMLIAFFNDINRLVFG